MSSRFEFVVTGIGSGHLQRIASNSQFTEVQTAYRAYIAHGIGCATCAVDSALCSTAGALWETYQAANSS